MCNFVIEWFDDGVVLEYVVFLVIMVIGFLLWLIIGYGVESDWFVLKMLIVFGVFLLIEIVDYYLVYLVGNKKCLCLVGKMDEYEC